MNLSSFGRWEITESVGYSELLLAQSNRLRTMTRFSQPSFLQGAPRPLVLSIQRSAVRVHSTCTKRSPPVHPALLSLGKRERRNRTGIHFLAAARLLITDRPRDSHHHRDDPFSPLRQHQHRPALNERPICRRFSVGQSDASVMISRAGWSRCQQSPWTISHSPTCTSRCTRWSPRSIIEPNRIQIIFCPSARSISR